MWLLKQNISPDRLASVENTALLQFRDIFNDDILYSLTEINCYIDKHDEKRKQLEIILSELVNRHDGNAHFNHDELMNIRQYKELLSDDIVQAKLNKLEYWYSKYIPVMENIFVQYMTVDPELHLNNKDIQSNLNNIRQDLSRLCDSVEHYIKREAKTIDDYTDFNNIFIKLKDIVRRYSDFKNKIECQYDDFVVISINDDMKNIITTLMTETDQQKAICEKTIEANLDNNHGNANPDKIVGVDPISLSSAGEESSVAVESEGEADSATVL